MEAFSLTLVAAAHLVAVDVAMAAPALCLWLQWRADRDELARRLDRDLLRLALVLLLVAVALGGMAVALIGRLYPQAYLHAFSELPRRRYEFGVVELIFTLVCYGVALRISSWRNRTNIVQATPRRWFALRWWATFLGALNLAYHFPPLFVMLGVLTVRPETWGHDARFTSLLADGEILARTVHHWLAALVVAGMAAAYLGTRRGAPPLDRRAVWGCRLAAAAMSAQILSGFLLVAELPVPTRHALLGDDLPATGLFAAALIATFFALPRLAATALGHAERRYVLGSCLLVMVIMLLMTATRHRTRDLMLDNQRRTGATSRFFIRQERPVAIYSRNAHGTDHAHRLHDGCVCQTTFRAGLQLLQLSAGVPRAVGRSALVRG